MQLREFSFVSPEIDAGEVFKAIESTIPITEIDQVVTASAKDSQRRRKLPAHLVVCLIIAMSLWSKAAMRDVLKNLVGGLSSQWTRLSQYCKVPNSGSISEARQRLGPQVMRQKFIACCSSVGNPSHPWSFSGWMTNHGSRWHIAGCP
jgi:Insertion element 4 transposase N-terminal